MFAGVPTEKVDKALVQIPVPVQLDVSITEAVLNGEHKAIIYYQQ